MAEAEPPPPVRLPPPRLTPQRMPPVEEFPAVAQRQIAQQQNRIANIADHANAKKKSLLERMASIGLGRKEAVPAPEPVRAEPKIQAQAPPPRQPEPPAPEPQLDDDQLEIPAFLRRQAN